MGITGNMKTMELAELLQWVSQGRKTGTLVIDDGRVEKRIFFERGTIVSSASTDPKEHLGHFLVSHGFISEEQLAEAVRRQEEERAMLGSVLVGMGAIAEEQLHAMLRLKAEEGIHSLFGWTEGEFRFLDDQLPPYTMVPISLDVTGLVLEASRRIDEAQRIRAVIPSMQAVPVAVADSLADDPKLDERQRRILAAVNDDRTIEEIALETHASEFTVCEALYPRVVQKKVKIVRPRALAPSDAGELGEVGAGTLLERGRELLGLGIYDQALRHLAAARSLDPENPKVQEGVATAEDEVRRVLELRGLVPSAVPRLNRGMQELAGVRVTPREGFVLSRIDGRYDLASILKISPIPPLEALLVLWQLVEAGHVRLGRPSS